MLINIIVLRHHIAYGNINGTNTNCQAPGFSPLRPPYWATGPCLEQIWDRDLKSHRYIVGDAKDLHKSILGLFQKCYSRVANLWRMRHTWRIGYLKVAHCTFLMTSHFYSLIFFYLFALQLYFSVENRTSEGVKTFTDFVSGKQDV